MATPEQEPPQERQKKTLWLLVAGTASLLIPLAGAVYLHWSQNAGAPGPSGHVDVFERREGEERKITPTQTAVVPATLMKPTGAIAGAAADVRPVGSSLDFIKSNAEVQARIADSKTAAAAPAASTAPAAPAADAPAPAAAAKTKSGKKAFAMPKLQPTRGFSSFGSTGSKGAAKAGAQTGQNAQDFLKNLPPGSQNDPQVQAYLKAHQGQ
jgi:hypothetical protein